MKESLKIEPNKGFTLIELIVVLSIITILAGIFVPTLSSLRDTALRSQCREQLQRIADAIVQRAEFLARSPEFNYALWVNESCIDLSGYSPNPCINSAHQWTIAHYLPIYSQGDPNMPTNYSVGIELVTTTPHLALQQLTEHISFFVADAGSIIPHSGMINGGGPYIGISTNQYGTSLGKQVIYQDPWGKDLVLGIFDPSSSLFDTTLTTLWYSAKVLHGTWAGGSEIPSDPELSISIHLYPTLAEETMRRIKIVNKAIEEYNRIYLPDQPLPDTYWNWDKTELADDLDFGITPLDSGVDTAYAMLLRKGLLERPTFQGDSGPMAVDMYAFDPYGWALVADMDSNTFPTRTGAEPPMRVISLNLTGAPATH